MQVKLFQKWLCRLVKLATCITILIFSRFAATFYNFRFGAKLGHVGCWPVYILCYEDNYFDFKRVQMKTKIGKNIADIEQKTES